MKILWICDHCGEVAMGHLDNGRCLFEPNSCFEQRTALRLVRWSDVRKLQDLIDRGQLYDQYGYMISHSLNGLCIRTYETP